MYLYYEYYCNGIYRGTSNTRVAADTEYDTKECRFHFFAAGDIAEGEEIIYNNGVFETISVWTEFGL